MLLKENEFSRNRYERIEVISNTDSGLYAVQYEEVNKADAPILEADGYSWRYRDKGDSYTLVIPKPKQRNILRTMIVSRTSTNHYEIAYADALGCMHETAKSVSAVHDMLTPLWARKLTE